MHFFVSYKDDPTQRVRVSATVEGNHVKFSARGHEDARAHLHFVLGTSAIRGMSSLDLSQGIRSYICKRIRKNSPTMGLDGRSVRKERALLFQKIRDSKTGDRFYFYGHLLEVLDTFKEYNDGRAEYGICPYNQGMYLARWSADQGRWVPQGHTSYYCDWHKVIRFVKVLEFPCQQTNS